MGIEESAKDKVIKASFELLNLISFFTTKGDQMRAWAVRKGTSALEAAGKIHSDIQRGFIKAEVINFNKFKECGSMNETKNRGQLRLEGKEYIVQDGDIINFRFNFSLIIKSNSSFTLLLFEIKLSSTNATYLYPSSLICFNSSVVRANRFRVYLYTKDSLHLYKIALSSSVYFLGLPTFFFSIISIHFILLIHT